MCLTQKRSVNSMNCSCRCECECPILLPIEEEVERLEEHKKMMYTQIVEIDKKITSLRSVTR